MIKLYSSCVIFFSFSNCCALSNSFSTSILDKSIVVVNVLFAFIFLFCIFVLALAILELLIKVEIGVINIAKDIIEVAILNFLFFI